MMLSVELVELNGRSYAVSVEPIGADRYRVVVDGQRYDVHAARAGEFGLSLIFDGSGASHDVQLAPVGRSGEQLVGVGGRTAMVTVNGRRMRRGALDGATDAAGEAAVPAPMAGRIVRLLVAVGDPVTARQGVVVVEAMKMENELRAPKSGTVKSINVEAGASVEAGRILLVIE